MRFFIALEIPDESRAELKAIQHKLKEIIPEIRITDNQKLHLTIAFIGERDEALKDKFSGVIEKAVAGISPFDVTPAYLDAFPNLHNPNIIWVGIKGDIDKLFVIRERIKDGLKSVGLQTDERRFIPHVAIAKLDNFKLNKDQESKIQQMMMEQFAPIQVSSIKLFESIPNHGFHQHNTLAEIKLK